MNVTANPEKSVEHAGQEEQVDAPADRLRIGNRSLQRVGSARQGSSSIRAASTSDSALIGQPERDLSTAWIVF
ncbi:MAG: hypothetical protein ABI881_13120 [Betaproteobacteria bacterium]